MRNFISYNINPFLYVKWNVDYHRFRFTIKTRMSSRTSPTLRSLRLLFQISSLLSREKLRSIRTDIALNSRLSSSRLSMRSCNP